MVSDTRLHHGPVKIGTFTINHTTENTISTADIFEPGIVLIKTYQSYSQPLG